MIVLFILAGAGLGAIAAGPAGALLGALTGYLLDTVIKLRSEIGALTQSVMQLSQTTRSDNKESLVKAAPPQPESNPIAQQSTPVRADAATSKMPDTLIPSPGKAATTPEVIPSRSATVVSTPRGQPQPTFVQREPLAPIIINWVKNYFSSGNTLVRIGVVVLFIGMVFLVKYAAEQGIVPIELRMTGVALAGLAMLVLGWRARVKNAGFSLALQGGGVGVIYLTTFAALRLYHLIPSSMAFAVLFATCALSAALAVLQNSRALAILGFSGGFLAPVLTSSGGGSHVMLFSYFAVLNAGILGIAWYKSWRILNLVGFVFTFIIGTSWGVLRYRADLFATTEPFLVLFFLFYVAISVLYALRQPVNLRGYVDGTLVFGTPVVVFGLQYFLVRNIEYGLAYSALTTCVFYVLLAYSIFKFVAKYNTEDQIKLLCQSFLSIGIVFGTVAIPLALDDQWTSACWALEGCALIYIAVKQRRVLAYFSGLFLQFAAAWFVLQQIEHSSHIGHWLLINGAYISGLLVSMAGCFSAYLIYKHQENIKYYLLHTDHILLAWGVGWWLFSAAYEISGHARWSETGTWVLVLGSVTAALAHIIGRRYAWNAMSLLDNSLGLFLLLGFGHSLADLSHPFSQWNSLAWLLSYSVYYSLLKRNDNAALSPLQKLQHGLGVWLISILICWESSWWVSKVLPTQSSWADILWLLLPALFLVAILKANKTIPWPFKQHHVTYYSTVSLPIVVYITMFSVIIAISNEGNTAPLDYIPLLNPLDITLAFAFVCLSFWYITVTKSQNAINNLNLFRAQLSACLAALAFIMLNSSLLRTIHHWTGMPYNIEAIIRSDLAQTSLSLFWALLAVTTMVISSKKYWRLAWIVGVSLIAVVVVKLFTFDLANVGTVERIISFIAVGVLMLAVGYFAPLPPAREHKTTLEKTENEPDEVSL